MHPDQRIARLAGRQHGLVTHGQLTRLGLGRGAIWRRRESGHLQAVRVGVYAVGHLSLTDSGRLLAAVMACGPEALLSHVHAAHQWNLLPPWHELDLSLIHVTVPRDCWRGRREGIRVHRSEVSAAERTSLHAIPVTSAARTLLDLGAVVDVRSLERAIDQAITDERATPRELRAELNGSPRSRGAGKLRVVLDAGERFDKLTRSQLEEAFLRLVRRAGLRQPSLNTLVEGMRVDAVWPEARVAVELDGYRWHRTRSRQESDRGREMKLRRAGWTTVRYSARQVFDEELLVLADLVGVLAGRRA